MRAGSTLPAARRFRVFKRPLMLLFGGASIAVHFGRLLQLWPLLDNKLLLLPLLKPRQKPLLVLHRHDSYIIQK